HPRVQAPSRAPVNRERSLGRRGRSPARRQRGLPPQLAGRRPATGRGCLPRPGEPDPGRRRTPPPPRRGHAPPRRTRPLKKSRGLLRQPPELTFRFIAEHAGACPVAWACAALDVSESGYYAWLGRRPCRAQRRRDELLAAVRQIPADVKGRYGSPRMTAELNARGYACTENTVAQLMRAHGIRAKAARRFVRTTDSRHSLPVADNLLDRQFEPDGPNAAWSCDITYLPTADGWLYLAVVEDLFSRKIVGWSMDATMTSRLVVAPWTWRCAAACPRRGCWRTPTAAASTPARTTSGC